MSPRLSIALAGSLLVAAPAPAQEHEALTEPWPSESFARLYPTRCKTFVKSSSDPEDFATAPSVGNDDGFSGANAVEAYRTRVRRMEAAVLADIAGRPGFVGCFFRNFWSGYHGVPLSSRENNRVQVLIDGALVHDRPLADFFRNPAQGQVAPFDGPFTGNRAGAHLTHTPMVWQQRFRLRVFENAFQNANRFHKVCGTLGAPDVPLPVPDLAAWEEIERRRGTWPHRVDPDPRVHRLRVPAGGAAELGLTGPGTVLMLRCSVRDTGAWSDLGARFSFDGRGTVDVPLRTLGGLGPAGFAVPAAGLLFHNDGAHTFTSYFPMPFADGARLGFVNRGGRPVDLRVGLHVERSVPEGEWGHFAAYWQEGTTVSGRVFRGPELHGVRGMLRHVALETGMEDTGRIPDMAGTHLEGDLCVRINGNRGDEHTFAASETGIGKWGWYFRPSDVPFARDASVHSGIQLRSLPGGFHRTWRSMASTLVFDPIHFVDGIEMVLEHGPHNSSNADYGLFTVFYLQPTPARRPLFELDVGDPAQEAAHGVSFTAVRSYRLTASFFRDAFFGTPPMTSTVREIRDFYRFTVPIDQDRDVWAYALECVLDRERLGDGGVCQADVLVNGRHAGLLHSWTSNGSFRWKEGGELEVELPVALTAGARSLTIEIRPRQGGDPLRLAAVRLHGYSR